MRGVCTYINWHAEGEFHVCDRRDNCIGHLLALLIDLIEQLILLGIPEQAAQNGIQGGIFELLGRKNVGGPIGSTKVLGYIEAVIDSDGLGECGPTAISQPDSRS